MRPLLILLITPVLLWAQDFEFQQEFDTIPVEIERWQPFCPWAGGMTGSNPAVVDFDFDGDMDFFVGEYFGKLVYFLNIGTGANPIFHFESNYFDSIDVGARNHPCFRDMDADGDLDLIIGDNSEHVYFYRNIGTVQEPIYQLETINLVPYPPSNWGPELIDIDADGDYDLFVGSEGNGPFFYENTGSPLNPAFSAVTENYLTLNLATTAKPQLVDINGDAAIDMLVAEYSQINYFTNLGTNENPEFLFIEDNWQSIYHSALKICFCDIDADGDFDLFCGEGAIPGPPSVALYLNRGTPQEPQFVLHDPDYITNNSFFVNANPGLTDIDADGDYDMFISDDDGHFFYYQNIGDSLTPNFTYIDSQWQGIQFLYPRDGWRGFDFVDIDDDLDYDLFTESHVDYNMCFYRNTGTPQNANMVLEIEVMFPEYSFEPIPSFVDIDLDGDQDLFCGENNGGIFFFRNVTEPPVGPKRPLGPPIRGSDISLVYHPVTGITFSIPTTQNISLSVYNLLGRKVATIVSGRQPAGTHSFLWNPSQHASGVYIIRLKTPQSTSSQRVMVVK